MPSLILKADHRAEGPVTIGDPSVPEGNTLTLWGDRPRPLVVRDPGVPLLQYRGQLGALDPLAVWRSQPSVRKVVGFVARNVAALPWKVYRRDGDTDRVRMAGSPAERALRNPQRHRSGFQVMRDVVTDACLYDAWCIAYLRLPGDAAERLYRISPRLLRIIPGPLGTIEQVGIIDRSTPGAVLDITDLPIAIGAGWADTGAAGVSPMTTLQAILTEQANAVDWRNRKWVTSPKTAGLLKRPAASVAGKWEPRQREAFLNTWRGWREGTADGTPILEDGMEYEQLDGLKPVDAADIAGRQLTDAEVAAAFYVAPELVGARATTFANVAAFREMLFGPALGPYISDLEQAVNGELLTALDDTTDLYAELDREAGMAGSFAEQVSYLQTATGGPFLTRAEARAKLNLPYIEGSDELITPLNVTAGGQASPTDSGSQNVKPGSETVAPAPSDGKALPAGRSVRKVAKASGPTAAARDELRDVVADLFRRMAVDIDGPIADPLTFHLVWDAITAKALESHLAGSADRAARKVLRDLGTADDAWAASVMAAYLKAMADTHGGRMVAHVIEAAGAEWAPDPAKPDDGPSHNGLVAALAIAAGALSATALADASGFGAHDAAHASGASEKTWETGPNPRPSHADIDGETVAFDDTFSVGVLWPGDSRGLPEETAGCNCGVSFLLP